MTILYRLFDRFLRWTRPFYDALRQDRFFLGCCLVGSYLVLQIVGNAATGRYVSVPVFLLGVVILLAGMLKRLIDVECATNREAHSR